jgi:beta-glucosidase-like glycosyl hydrolase
MQGNVTADDWDNAKAPLLKTAPTIKHYAAYDLECSSGGSDLDFFGCDAPGVDRFHFDAVISNEDMAEYYLQVFAAPIQKSKPASIMCSFNSINGEPSCSSDLLMNQVARGKWGFSGFTVSDCGGVSAINTGHYKTSSPTHALARALHGGLDAECGMNPPNSAGYYFQKRTNQALAEGVVNISTVDQALLRKWRTALRLGLFQQATPWDHLGRETIRSPKHVALTLHAAEQSMTLLKNSNNSHGVPTLPLREAQLQRSVTKVALIGPALDLHGGDMQGPYSGQANVSSVLDALLARFGSSFNTKFVINGGTPAGDSSNSTVGVPAAVATVQQPDVDLVLLFVNDQFVSEGADRTDTRLMWGQAQLIERIAEVGKPIVPSLAKNMIIQLGHQHLRITLTRIPRF